MKHCKRELVRWSSYRNREVEKEIKQKTERLKNEQKNEGPHNVEIIKTLHGELGLLLEQEDMKWKQRANRTWYQLGDKNTKFFHSCASPRRM